MSGEQKKPEIVAFSRRKPRNIITFNFRLNRKVIAVCSIILITAVLGVSGLLYKNYYNNNLKIRLSIGDTKLTIKEFKELISEASSVGVGAFEARFALIDMIRVIEAGKKSNIVPTDEMINAKLLKNFALEDSSRASDWKKYVAKADAVRELADLKKVGGYKGVLIEAPFSRNFDIYDKTQAGPDFGNQSAIEADNKYANQKIEEYKKRILDKPESALTIIDEIKKDDRLIIGSSGNKSTLFTVTLQGRRIGSGSLPSQFISDGGIDSLSGLKIGQSSEIRIKKMTLSYYEPNQPRTPKEVAYYFYVLQDKIEKDVASVEQFNSELIKIKVSEGY